MSPSRARARAPSTAAFAPILLANLVPLVGVLAYGWEPTTLVAIYALEVLLAFPLAAAKTPFAGRPPRVEDLEDDGGDSSVLAVGNTDLARKRGSVELVSWLPPVYPRNLPFVGAVLFASVWTTLFVVAALAQVAVHEALARPEVWLGVAALIAGQGVETWRDYLRSGRYETTSPYAVVEAPARQAFFLIFVLLVVAETSGAVVLAAFVAVKLLVDWSAFRATRGDGGRLTGWLAGPEGADERSDPPRPPDDDFDPSSEPDARVPTHTRTVVLTGVLHTLVKPAPFYVGIVLLAWVVILAVLGGNGDGGWFAVALLVGSALLAFAVLATFLAIKVAEHVLEYAPLEYRRYGDRLVAYDAWVDEIQWIVPLHEIRDVTLVFDRFPDRVFDARTLEARTGWGDDESTRALGPVGDADAFVEALDLPVRTAELELKPMDRRIAALAIVPVVGVVVVAVAFAVGPWPLLAAVPYVFFGLPFAAPVLHGLWRRAYPDPESQ
ncbi:DUF6498-containing protein [Natrarchaeobius oligotrophus]|uniref:Uncharacterized protein n=1 Tax=Natrarchaeobius chitinivorans TaxID=1679083 RepID=A0A3N6MU69_NATCH|nr:DUF6498-containing protein [Natrarchaeobius chitinivorans]RQH01481.1 hypothetical protein EA472_07005 [Natrarchaeobius chitinivorans]